jgi:hypothetical protein
MDLRKAPQMSMAGDQPISTSMNETQECGEKEGKVDSDNDSQSGNCSRGLKTVAHKLGTALVSITGATPIEDTLAVECAGSLCSADAEKNAALSEEMSRSVIYTNGVKWPPLPILKERIPQDNAELVTRRSCWWLTRQRRSELGSQERSCNTENPQDAADHDAVYLDTFEGVLQQAIGLTRLESTDFF